MVEGGDIFLSLFLQIYLKGKRGRGRGRRKKGGTEAGREGWRRREERGE